MTIKEVNEEFSKININLSLDQALLVAVILSDEIFMLLQHERHSYYVSLLNDIRINIINQTTVIKNELEQIS